MAELTEKARTFLSKPNFAALATVNPSGAPQVSAMWIHLENGHVIVNTAIGRRKELNMRRDPRVSITVTDVENPYDKVSIQGRVVRFVEGDEAERMIDFLSEKYTGQTPYPWRGPDERRVTIVIEPLKVSDER
jgi:PPOX class probable F420-dependent enzyme